MKRPLDNPDLDQDNQNDDVNIGELSLQDRSEQVRPKIKGFISLVKYPKDPLFKKYVKRGKRKHRRTVLQVVTTPAHVDAS